MWYLVSGFGVWSLTWFSLGQNDQGLGLGLRALVVVVPDFLQGLVLANGVNDERTSGLHDGV